MRYVYDLDHPHELPADELLLLVGGKAANLGGMAGELGLPVPPGFVISTAACHAYLSGEWPAGLDDEIAEHISAMERILGRRFGDPQDPLLVSVRSGAPVSMPGMMDTLLNVGMTPEIRARLEAETGDAGFAADTWLRFCRMYAEIVLGLGGAVLTDASAHEGSAAGKLAAAERIRRLSADT